MAVTEAVRHAGMQPPASGSASLASAQAAIGQARRRTRRRHRILLSAFGLVLVLVFLARVTLGDFVITIPDAIRIIGGEQMPGASYILMESKLPRAVLGVLVGAAFGAAGAIFQTTLRNPLAAPDILGVNFGASASAVFAIVTLGATGWGLAIAAMLGAVAVALLVRLVAGSNLSGRLILVGIGLNATLFAMVQYLFTRADEWDAQLVLTWLTGSLARADWHAIGAYGLALGVLAAIVVVLARSTRIAELGEDLAAGLGVPASRSDLLLLVAVMLCALAVAAAGPLAFVAFLAGPVARALNRGRATIAGAALVGAVLVVGADYVGAYAVAEVNYPAGVITGALGAPFLLWLLATGRASRRS